LVVYETGGVPMNGSAAPVMPVDARASGRIAHAALRGAIAAMAMTGMRAFTISLGIVEESPPQAIIRQRAKLLIRRVSRKRRRATVELVHWSYGAIGGAAFAILPKTARRRAWAGPVYGLFTWAGFEAVIAPTLGLTQARKLRMAERVALAADHLLYGLVLSEIRQQPRE
jgi:uncharacterized membrane protein YagU involved in acid resistance